MPLLDWLNKSQALKAAAFAPFRLLDEVPELSYGDEASDNMLIQGDNLDGLKALLPLYAGKVKCVFIDPPYNTGSAFGQYDDNLEHSIWLSLLYPRLELLHTLLSNEGSLWIAIDDNEAHYLKVICDEIFGRKNFVSSVVWCTSDSSNNNATKFSLDHNYILIYAKNQDWKPRFLDNPSKRSHFKNPDNNPRGPWFDGNNVQNPGLRPNLQFNLTAPNGNVIKHPPNGWRWSKETIEEKMKTGEIRFSEDGKRIIRRTYLADMEGLPPSSLWTDLDETGHNRQAKYELKNLFPNEAVTSLFSTPKPEKLIKKILELSTDNGDLVLDSFLGSGTTAAVAHKMNRRYIGIEIGEQCESHCVPRLKKVIDGTDLGGISVSGKTKKQIPLCKKCTDLLCEKCSELIGENSSGGEQVWFGGGGFHYYKLGAEIFLPNGNINPDVKFKQLASFVWFAETKRSLRRVARNPLLGIHEDTAYYLLYNGILGDHRPNGGNVLTRSILKELPAHDGPKVIYGDSSLLGVDTLKKNKIVFKQIPYEVRTR